MYNNTYLSQKITFNYKNYEVVTYSSLLTLLTSLSHC